MSVAQDEKPNRIKGLFWFWWRQIFHWWALALALLVFVPAGFLIGYEVRQPSLAMPATQDLLERLEKVESLLIAAQVDEPRDLNVEAMKLTETVNQLRASVDALSPQSSKSIRPKIIEVVGHAETLQQRLRGQNLKYDKIINQNLDQLRALKTGVEKKLESSSDWRSILYDQMRRFLKWIGAISFLTLLVVILFLLAMNNPDIRKMVAKSGSISAFGVSINFNDLQSVRASIGARGQAIEHDVAHAYVVALRSSRIEQFFANVVLGIEAKLSTLDIDLSKVEYRTTLFVPGFVGEDLVQAARYRGNWNLRDETVVGRRFSVRYGIIGKAWRLRGCQYNPSVDNNDKNLVRNWGFTESEAAPFATGHKPGPASASLMAFVVPDIGDAPPLGVIYIEAVGANCLHTAAKLAESNDVTKCERYAKEIWEGLDGKAIDALKQRLIRLQSEFRWNDKIQEGAGR